MKRSTGATAMLCSMSLYMMQSLPNGIGSALAGISEAYSGYSLTAVTWVAMIVSVASIPSNLLCRSLIQRLGFRPVMYIGYALGFIGGLTPFFLTDNFPALIVCRGMVGLAYGLFLPMGDTYASMRYSGERSVRIKSIGASVSCILNMLLTLLSGILVTYSLDLVWLYHLYAIIPFAFSLLMPKTPVPVVRESGRKRGGRLSGAVVFLIAVSAFSAVLAYPNSVYVSNIVSARGLGLAVQASYALTLASLAAAAGGILFPPMFRRAGLWTAPLALLVFSGGYLMIMLSESIAAIYVGNLLTGFASQTFAVYISIYIGRLCGIELLPLALGIRFTANSMAAILSVYLFSFASRLFGRPDDFMVIYGLCAACLFIFAVVLIPLQRVFLRSSGARARR